METHRASQKEGPALDRGDLPVWLVVLIMTAGLAALVWGVAHQQIRDALAQIFG